MSVLDYIATCAWLCWYPWLHELKGVGFVHDCLSVGSICGGQILFLNSEPLYQVTTPGILGHFLRIEYQIPHVSGILFHKWESGDVELQPKMVYFLFSYEPEYLHGSTEAKAVRAILQIMVVSRFQDSGFLNTLGVALSASS